MNDYYTQVKGGVVAEWPHAAPTWLAVTRLDYVVRRVALEQSEYQVLAALAAGHNLAAALERVDGVEAARVAEWFASWGRLRFLADILCSSSVPHTAEKEL